MQFTDQFHDVFHELLAPIQQSMGDRSDTTVDLAQAREQFQLAADTLEDVGEDAAAHMTRTLGQLLELADDAAIEENTDASETRREIVSFVGRFLSIASNSIGDEASDPQASLLDLIDEANERWGDALQLLGDDPNWGIEEAAFPETDSFDDSPQESESTIGTDQVGLILSTLTNATGASESDRNDAVNEAASTSDSGNQLATGPFHDDSASPNQTVELAPEMLEAYLEDACQCLASMERVALEFEHHPENPELIKQLCRELHTLKGASGSVGLNELAKQLHEVEEALEHSESATADAGVVDLVMNCVDAVRAKVAALQSTGNDSSGDASSAAFEAAPAQSLPSVAGDERSDGRDSVRVRTAQLDRLMDLLAELVIWRRRRDERVTQLDTAADELSHCLSRLESVKGREMPEPARGAEGLGLTSNYLSEIGNDLREITQSLRQSRREMAEENRAVSQFILQFRQELVQIRRVPLSGLFQRLHRSVREAARVEGKQVRLELRGEHAGLERSLQERLYEPLLHLVRNAVSHGIESPEQRVKAGKDPVGIVSVEAYGSSHVLIIEIRDDGRGLDYDAIRRRGLERGLIFADRPASESELARLIFRPGFSTRDEANEISGRGVGMDVVASALDRCHCHIETESEPGKGTRFRLTMPLRSVIEHALLFRCGGQSFGLPMQFIRSASQSGQERPLDESCSRSVELGDLLQLTNTEGAQSWNWLEIGDRLASSLGETISVEGAAEHRLRLYIDDVLGPEEVVVRPLPPLLRRHPHLCGATLSGAGDVVFLLDGRRLVQDSFDRKFEQFQVRLEGPDQPALEGPESVKVLVVDDSLSARRRLARMLGEMGFEITNAGDGSEAIDLIRNGSFDAVFSDLEMPHLGGFDLLNELAALPQQSPPCVIVTTRNEPETRDRAIELGADGFLAKPVEESAVLELLPQLNITPSLSLTGDA